MRPLRIYGEGKTILWDSSKSSLLPGRGADKEGDLNLVDWEHY